MIKHHFFWIKNHSEQKHHLFSKIGLVLQLLSISVVFMIVATPYPWRWANEIAEKKYPDLDAPDSWAVPASYIIEFVASCIVIFILGVIMYVLGKYIKNNKGE